MTSYSELIETLKRLDEVTLLELLEISSEDLVERFPELIEEKRGYIQKELELGE